MHITLIQRANSGEFRGQFTYLSDDGLRPGFFGASSLTVSDSRCWIKSASANDLPVRETRVKGPAKALCKQPLRTQWGCPENGGKRQHHTLELLAWSRPVLSLLMQRR